MMACTIRSAIGPSLRAPMPPIRKHWSKHICAGSKRCGVGADTSSGCPMAGGAYPTTISSAPAPMMCGTARFPISSYGRFPDCRSNASLLPRVPPGWIESSSGARRRSLPRRDSEPKFGLRWRNELNDWWIAVWHADDRVK